MGHYEEDQINLFEIEEKEGFWFIFPSECRCTNGIKTDRDEMIDLAVNILHFTGATQKEISEVKERIPK